ncbi:MAG: ribonuclease HIII [Sphaerochaetaceae bacterium]|nr:ribonuclease HIII [Sphaerochaetaceae bacterium]
MNYDFIIDSKNINKMVSYYHNYLEDLSDTRIMYSFKSQDFKITIYNTKKVLFQGKKSFEEYEKWAKVFALDIPKPIDYHNNDNLYLKQRIIGSDEVGTGDFFGPVVVCAAYCRPNDLKLVQELKIQDSKNINDKKIRELGEILIDKFSYHVLVLPPKKYNELVQKGYNLNKIKAFLHNHAIKKMVDKNPSYQNVILDQFCSPTNYFNYLGGEETFKNIKFHTKAESIHPAVAIASIIARYKFLLEMDSLSDNTGITLPKGAGPGVDAIGKLIYLKHGKSIFENIAKVNFKNIERIL